MELTDYTIIEYQFFDITYHSLKTILYLGNKNKVLITDQTHLLHWNNFSNRISIIFLSQILTTDAGS